MDKDAVEELIVQSTTIEKEDMLSALCKSQECNLKVSGVHYRSRDYGKKNVKGRAEWRAEMIRRIFVDTGVVAEEILFDQRGGKAVLREVVRDMHPLSQKDKNNTVGPTIVIALTQSSLANDIKETVRKDVGLTLTKPKRGRENETIRITSHLPPILEAKRNECLRERCKMIAASGGTKRFICEESFRFPWISLLAVDGDKKTAIPFEVEDPRLADPARQLAFDHLRGIRKFTPYFILSPPAKAALGGPVMIKVPPPTNTAGAVSASQNPSVHMADAAPK